MQAVPNRIRSPSRLAAAAAGTLVVVVIVVVVVVVEAFAALIPVKNNNVYTTKYLMCLNTFAVSLLANLITRTDFAGVARCQYFSSDVQMFP